MYNWALSKDLVEFNPVTGIPRPGAQQQRDRVLSEDEIKAIWKALDREKPIMAATFRLRLLTAQPGAEVRAMRWQDIDGDWWTIPDCDQQPLACACMRKANRLTLAVVKDVGGFVDDEIGEAIVLGEVTHRDEAGRLLA